jgi:polyferredoxin
MKKDFNDFIESTDDVPLSLDKRVMGLISRELNPSVTSIGIKLITIHAFVGIITMLFCPQFSLSLTNNYEVFHYFHHTFGTAICNIICGAIFMGTGAIFAVSILSTPELRKIKRSPILYYTALSIITISIFFVLGVEMYLSMVLLWGLGAVVSSSVFIYTGLSVRLKLKQI